MRRIFDAQNLQGNMRFFEVGAAMEYALVTRACRPPCHADISAIT